MLLMALWLNGFAAYLLAVDRLRDRGAAMLAGLIFGGAAYLSLHLLGHFNLIHAWGIPLFVLMLLRTIEPRRPVFHWTLTSAFAGAVLVLVAYTDYYYLVYCVALATFIVGAERLPLTVVTARRRVSLWLRALLAVLAVVDVAIAVAIVATGGFTFPVGGRVVSAHSVTNPLTLLWVIGILWLTLHSRLVVRRTADRAAGTEMVARRLLPMAVVALAGLAPLIVRGAAMWMRGDYVTAPHSWRSGPGGVDVATFALGNPMSALTGWWTSGAYTRLGIDRIEKTGWIGFVPMVLTFWMLMSHRDNREVRRWLSIGTVFLVWALGPWLRLGDVNLGLPLPQILFGFVPVLSNARMPGRAMVVVMLAAAMLAAVAVTRFDPRRRMLWLSLALTLVVADFLPAPFPTVAVGAPRAYALALAGQPPGALCPLPLGYRDGYGEVGRFDSRTLLDQMTHGHPVAGGFVGRLPPSVRRAYGDTPVLRSLLQLSKGEAANADDLALTPADSAGELLRRNIRFVALDQHTASTELVAYVRQKLPLRLVADDSSGPRLYEITSSAGR